MSDKPRFYIESDQFRDAIGGRPVQVLDAGSRGGIVPPFDRLRSGVAVTGFEPDAEAADAGSVNKALWKRTGTIDIHVASEPSASSVYPPDMDLLTQFSDRVGEASRATRSVATVEAVSIDDAVRRGLCPQPDFIKLDIHSAEYEALRGAAKSLADVAGVLVETWHLPVHRGQHLHAEIEQLLNESGLHLFSLTPAAAWRVAVDDAMSRLDRPRMIASDALFFREPTAVAELSQDRALAAIALADLFGYTNHAILLGRECARAGVIPADLQTDAERELTRLRERRRRREARRRKRRRRRRQRRRGLRGRARRSLRRARAILPSGGGGGEARTLQERTWKLQSRVYTRLVPLFARRMPRPEVSVPTETHGRGGGTYVICPEGISEESVVYSFGVGADVAFDLSLIERFGLTVHAFDPTDQSAAYVASRELPESFHFHRWAIADSNGETEFRRLTPGSKTYLPGTVLATGSAEGVSPVQALSLSTVMERLGHDFIDVLKLDVEGAELPVIEGLRGAEIPAGQIVLEVHPHLANLERHSTMIGRSGWRRAEEALDTLRANGYRVFHVSARGTEFSLIRR